MLRYLLFSLMVWGGALFADFSSDKNAKIYVAGDTGMVGSAIVRNLQAKGYTNFVTRTSMELDLRNQAAVSAFFEKEKPEYVFLAAAKVGGIIGNSLYPAEFIRDNLQIEVNVIDSAHKYGTKKLLFLGSSCIYPRNCPQPMKEEYLLTGALEKTNEAYAIAKIAGLMMCQKYREQHGANFISCMPTNLYGAGDNFHLQNSHVLPALMLKMHAAKVERLDSVTLWGTGNAYREFLHVDDCADACVFLMEHYNGDTTINVGSEEDLTIKELAEMVKDVVGYTGNLVFDTTKPDGTPKKLLDVTRLHDLGWKHKIVLQKGVEETYKWFLEQKNILRKK